MPLVLLIKETAVGPVGRRSARQYGILAVIPCCVEMLAAKPRQFVVRDKYGSLSPTFLGSDPQHCPQCNTFLGVHILVREDKTYVPCGSRTPYSYWGRTCTYRCKPGSDRCGMATHRR